MNTSVRYRLPLTLILTHDREGVVGNSSMGHHTRRILVASCRADQRSELRTALEIEGHLVAETESVEETTRRTCSGLYDVLIADSGMDGIGLCEMCRAIRPRSDLGIIVLASDDNQQGRIDALNAGADDFIPSPFVLAELLARVRAILRRVTPSGEGRNLVLQDRVVDFRSHEVKGPGSRVSHLTPKEFLVLQYLVAHANKPRTAQALAQTIWQRDGEGDLEYVRIVIRQLRRKIEPNPANPRYILTERLTGYRFQMPSIEGRASAELDEAPAAAQPQASRNDSRAMAL